MTKQRKRSEARKDEILRVALQIVDQNGIHALTLRELADRIGISEAALFRHFDGKENIVDSMAEWVFREYVVEESGEGDVGRVLTDLMRRQFYSFQDFPQATSVLFQEEIFREFPRAKEMFDQRRKERAERIGALLRKARSEGKVSKDIEENVFALIYMGSMRMAVLGWRSAGFSYDLVSQVEPIMRQLSRLLSPDGRKKKGVA